MKNIKKHKVYLALKNKIDNNGRMPSIKAIHDLLVEVGVNHKFDNETINCVEYRSGSNSYVNERHDGKVGKSLSFRAHVKNIKKSPFMRFGEVSNSEWIDLDSSSSYYSWNTYGYAHDLIKVLDNLNNLTFTTN